MSGIVLQKAFVFVLAFNSFKHGVSLCQFDFW